MTRKFLIALAGLLLAASSIFAKPAKKTYIVFVSGDHEYSSEETFPIIAKELETKYGFNTTVLKSSPDENSEENIPGLEALDKADVAVFFLRWRRLPAEQLRHIESYLKSGKPVVAFRTTTHAFNYPKGHELETWNSFAVDYLGGPPGWGNGHTHYGHLSTTDVSMNPAAKQHPILTGIPATFHVASWLYLVRPKYPPTDAEILLMGKSVNPNKPDAIENPVAWTWKNKAGARVFMTTLGHPNDFKEEAMQRLVINGIHWAAGKNVPKKWAGKMMIEVKYHGIRETKK